MMQITLTLSDRAWDGVVAHCNAVNQAAAPGKEWLTPESHLRLEMENHGQVLANSHRIGVITVAGLITRIEPSEYAAILQAGASNETVAILVQRLVLRVEPVVLTEDALIRGLQQLVEAKLLAPNRPAQITSWERPVFVPSAIP